MLAFGSCDAKLPFLPESEVPSDFGKHIDDVSEEEAMKNLASPKGAAVGFVCSAECA